ncbi:sensor histidine kinase [Allosediminivita pacifica]|uniref:histidine kinase n=1 Tax=Allosediminivita pacifica TaxID=1267769 RepID=A0A2T6APV6_9RHOB|nr:ATP-binding protein [Allosediminivita pacifica]PTX45853.1 two-component sensor histidine kinase [Allosediminivita pacifica]GGB19662.1 hypothetical protein GCM10011324_32210 [Allosediminivita pacifica]
MAHTITFLSLTTPEDIKMLREIFRAITGVIGFKPFLSTRLTTCALELARNVIEHGKGGHAQVSLVEPRGGSVMLRMVFTDQGPGIPDLPPLPEDDRALSGGQGLGLGLDGVRHMADDFDLQTGRGGTRVRADFAAPLDRAEMAACATSAADHCDEILMRQSSAERRIRQLEADLDERELMIGEVHHRTANNLTMISSLLRMEQRRAKTPETQDVLSSLSIRVESMARMHKLLQTGGAETVGARAYLSQISALAETFNRPGLDVKIEVEADGTAVPARLALDLGLITGELITNAYKHAFVGRRSGAIRISLVTEGDMIRYAFRDDGTGLSEGEMPERSGSLGWRMIRGSVAGNMGHMTVDGSDGLSIQISFPTELG